MSTSTATLALFADPGRGRLAVPACPSCGVRADSGPGIVDRVIVGGMVAERRTFACSACGDCHTDLLADPADTPSLF